MTVSSNFKSILLGMAALSAGALMADARSASAQEMTAAEAGELRESLLIWNAQLLEEWPALIDVEAAVTGSCREHRGEAEFVNYCSCGRSLVMYLWLNAGDETMKSRVETYAADPSIMTPADFLQYQGPELYKPFCDLALGTT